MSATKSKAEALYRFFASVRFAIVVLALIALASIAGTVIQQGADPAEYLQRYSESTYKVIAFLGLDDTYHAPWFYALILLFGINLTLCTADRLARHLKSDRAVKLPPPEALTQMGLSFAAPQAGVEELRRALGKGYRLRLEEADGAVFEKGGLSRYGVYVIHGSILLILAGSLIGLLWGFRGSLVLWEGETRDTIAVRGKAPRQVPLGFALKCKDFDVSFYESGEPKDFVSTLEVIEGGVKTLERQVRVNSPLEYRGFRIYQATYGSSPTFVFTVGKEKAMLKESEMYEGGGVALMVARFHEKIHDFGPGVLVAYIEGGEPKGQWFLKDVPQMREHLLAGTTVRLEEVRDDFYTGLEVARDPGVWVVWAGFALILAGLYVNFFLSYRRVYVRAYGKGVVVAGFCPKNRAAFAEEFEKLKGRVNGNQP